MKYKCGFIIQLFIEHVATIYTIYDGSNGGNKMKCCGGDNNSSSNKINNTNNYVLAYLNHVWMYNITTLLHLNIVM